MNRAWRISRQPDEKIHGGAPDNTAQKQGKAPPFEPGQSGNPAGRPKRARNKLGEELIAAIYDDICQRSALVMEKVRYEKPAEYLRIVASLVPRVLEIERPLDDLSDAELMAMIRAHADACGLVVTEAEDNPPQSKH